MQPSPEYPTQCSAVYDRILPGDRMPTHIRCTYIEEHPSRCSFTTLQVVDDTIRAEVRASVQTALSDPAASPELRGFLSLVQAGELDRHLELILSVGHDRKRARRGVAGFSDRDRF